MTWGEFLAYSAPYVCCPALCIAVGWWFGGHTIRRWYRW